MSSETINKIAHFAKYHNGFVVGLMLAFFGGAAIFAASPAARSGSGRRDHHRIRR